MSDTGLVIFMGIFAVIALVGVIFGIWCARRQEAMQAYYEGFFSRVQSFLFANITLSAVCCVLVGVAAPFVMGGTSPAFFIVGGLLALYSVHVYRKMAARYGKLAARELLRAMWIIENGKAMLFATSFFGVVTFEMLPHACIATARGVVCVVRCGENSYIDAEGNLYGREDLL